MLNRISVNAILKSVIAVLAAVVVVVLAQSAWTSWTRLKAVDRIVSVADASAHLFTALHNLRSDRSRSYRFLIADEQLAPKDFRLWESRDAEMPALKDLGPWLRRLEHQHGVQFQRAFASVRTNLINAEPIIRRWIASL